MVKNIKVFKFGGASVKNAEGIKNVAQIIKKFCHEPLVVVISASGKTTNHLEDVLNAFYQKSEDTYAKLQIVKNHHQELLDGLFDASDEVYHQVNDLFVEVEWILEESPIKDYDYCYDQLVSIGELLSTRIVAAYLNKTKVSTKWYDARDLILTDETYREAQILWDGTIDRVLRGLTPSIQDGKVVLTQGFIASTIDNQTTTLGREGSDFSAAILSYCLNAESMSIWKDVDGVLTADPRLFKNVQKLDRISYKEAIEMTYYGASVIHPKTIKPLQNKNIPLYVRSFIDIEGEGTFIGPEVSENYPPIIILEKDQVLINISTRDFSFVVEHHMADLFKLFADLRIFVNMMINTAISFSVCVPNVPDRIEKLKKLLADTYFITTEENLELLIIRHHHQDVVDNLTKGKIILLEERIRHTVQLVTKSVPLVERIDL